MTYILRNVLKEPYVQAGHTPHEEYPEKFNQLALAFLSE